MKFRTEYTPEKSRLVIDPEKPVVMAGSCFTQNMAEKMRQHEWEVADPFGTLYNPLSIGEAFRAMMADDDGKFEDSLFFDGQLWRSWLFDSSFASREKENCVAEFRKRKSEFESALQGGNLLIVTFGTSICYFLEGSQNVVGNCHKQPAERFYRRRLGIEETALYWQEILREIKARYPALQVVFTVSPVRHLKDGFTGNSRSKAVLQLAIEKICGENDCCHYFPAYEILNDDLRDYRFYASDLVHPSEEGVAYIWEKFIATYLDDRGLQRLREGSRTYKARHHRPMTGALGQPLNDRSLK